MSSESRNSSNSITIDILGRNYQIACSPDEEEALRKSARHLNSHMQKVKSRGSTLSFEKLAVMTALNITHEYLKSSRQATELESDSLEQIRSIEEKIDAALVHSRQMEI